MKFLRLTVFLAVMISGLSGIGAQGFDHSILVINAFYKGFIWTEAADSGFSETIRSEAPGLDLYYEYLDFLRFPAPESVDSFLGRMDTLYRGIDFDLIVLADDPAFDFFMGIRDEYFPGIPVVFYGVDEACDPRIHEEPLMTGVVGSMDTHELLELIDYVHPDMTHLALISDLTVPGQSKLRAVLDVIGEYRADWTTVVLDDWTLDELAASLEALPPPTACVQISGIEDRNGVRIPLEDEADFYRERNPHPSYTLWDFRLGDGVVGGVMTSGRLHGAEAAGMALQILAGTPADDIPVMDEDPHPVMFDYREMRRFGLRRSDLPKDAQIVNEPDNLWYRYRNFVIVAALFIVFLGTAVILLLVNVSRRLTAERKLLEVNENLEHLVRERTKELRESLARLERAQGFLVEAGKLSALGDLVSGLAHRLNTPLGVCITAASHIPDLIGRMRGTPEGGGDGIIADLDVLGVLLNENLAAADELLKSFRHIAAESPDDAPRRISLSSVLALAAASFHKRLSDGGVGMDVECPEDLMAVSYESSLLIILNNLIGNSLDHGFSSGQAHGGEKRIRISARADGPDVLLEYEDSGRGIEVEHRPKIFEPFYTSSLSSGGSGLGLFIVFTQVRYRLMGSISLKDSDGRGAAFVIRFPRFPGENAPAAASGSGGPARGDG